MAYNPINPTQLTPPRVAFIDERSGAISREWYRFFLSLVTSAQNSQDAADTGPDANSLLATYDAMLASVAQETQTNTSDLTASLQQQINDVFTESSTQPRAELGTMASVQQDNVRFLGFATSPSPPVVSAPGVVAWNNADGTLDIGMGYDGVTQQVGLEQYFRIKASATITNGQCIMFTGSVGASGVLKGAPATGVTNPQYIMGVATMDIANNGFGYVTSFGLVRGINTTGSSVGETWADGDILYYNPAFAGGLTNVPPTAPTPKIVVASVVNAGAGSSGSLFIRIQGEPDLHNLSDVYAPSPISNGQILIGDGPQSRWESATLTAGSGVSISNGAGSITISATGSGGTVTSVSGTGTVNGITLTGTVTSSGSLTLGGTLSNVSLTSQVTGTLPVTNGGTGTATAFTTGSVVFANASGIYTQDNTNFFWDNTNKRLGIGTAAPGGVLQLNKATGAVDMRLSVGGTLYGNVYASASDTTITSVTAIPLILGTDSTTRFQVGPVGQFGIGGATYGTAGQVLTSGGALAAPTWATPTTGTVTSVSGTGTVSGLTLSGTVTTSGSLTLGGTLAVTASNFSSQTANTFLAAPNGSAGVPTFRAIVAADVPTLNQNTTGTASNVTGTVAIANGGTGATTAPLARTALGATTVGSNVFTLTNPSAITFPRFNADNTVSALDAATFRTAIGAGTSSTTGTVTSVSGTGTVNGITLTGTVTSSGSLTLGGTLSGVSLTTQVSGTLPVGNGGTGATTFTANALLKGNTTSAVSASNVSDNGSTVSIGSGIGFSVARTAVTAPAAADGNVFSGTYTPTSFNTTNIAASTPQSAQYLRVGNTVTVSGQIDIDPTATGFAILGLSLPIASAITSAVQLSGVFNCPDAVGGGVYGDAANDRATFQFTASSAANLTYYYTFTYRVL